VWFFWKREGSEQPYVGVPFLFGHRNKWKCNEEGKKELREDFIAWKVSVFGAG
jgi:hypothetical protein